MLRELPAGLFNEWKMFEQLEPFPEYRADLNAAHIAQWIWASCGDPKKFPNGRPLSDFLLSVGDAEYSKTLPVTQDLAYQEMLIDAWIYGSNAVFIANAKGIH